MKRAAPGPGSKPRVGPPLLVLPPSSPPRPTFTWTAAIGPSTSAGRTWTATTTGTGCGSRPCPIWSQVERPSWTVPRRAPDGPSTSIPSGRSEISTGRSALRTLRVARRGRGRACSASPSTTHPRFPLRQQTEKAFRRTASQAAMGIGSSRARPPIPKDTSTGSSTRARAMTAGLLLARAGWTCGPMSVTACGAGMTFTSVPTTTRDISPAASTWTCASTGPRRRPVTS